VASTSALRSCPYSGFFRAWACFTRSPRPAGAGCAPSDLLWEGAASRVLKVRSCRLRGIRAWRSQDCGLVFGCCSHNQGEFAGPDPDRRRAARAGMASAASASAVLGDPHRCSSPLVLLS